MNYGKFSREQFDEAMSEILSDMSGEELLSEVPAIYELVAKHLKSDVFDALNDDVEEDADNDEDEEDELEDVGDAD